MLLLSYKLHLQYTKKQLFTILGITLQYTIITYYDLHIMLLKELQYNVVT